VLLRFDDLPDAVAAVLDLLDVLPTVGLPSGHAGVAAGYVIERDNDVFGRTVNLAARIADATPDGRLYVALTDVAMLPDDGYAVTPFDAVTLQGIGLTAIAEVRRTAAPTPADAHTAITSDSRP
jgi:adenylate cyclase